MDAPTDTLLSVKREALLAALIVGVALLLLYLCTAAPSLTFWDASEFATAIGTFGIPHPPGTPLYVALGRTVWLLSPFVSPVQAGTLLSAFATAWACAIAAAIVTRISASRVIGVVAGLCAGTLGTVWANATETEVYSVSLLCAALQCVVAWRAHDSDDDHARIALAFLAALSLPIHLSALVATPAAMLLACTQRDGRVQWRMFAGAIALVVATVALSKAMLGVAVFCIGAVALEGRIRDREERWLTSAALVTLLAWSALLILPVRAAFDPFLNQGNPDTLERLLHVVARTQYDVAPLWPRRTLWWLQIGNLLQYADWQVALSAWNDVGPSWLRTPFTALAALLGACGALAHWRVHRPSAVSAIVLFLLATLGIIVQLNLRAGPSYGAGILPDNTLHEARERDYFFALAFWLWGIWIGVGAYALCAPLASRVHLAARARIALVILVPALLVVGNWRAVTRRTAPDRDIAPYIGAELLLNSPRGALLFTVGDNDSYPLWYRQSVDSIRRDVQVVVTSLLAADWYMQESVDRSRDLSLPTTTISVMGRAGHLARQQLDRRGPVAVSALMPALQRAELANSAGIHCWKRVGLVDVAYRGEVCPPRIDAQRSNESANRLAPILIGSARQNPDGMNAFFQQFARCPGAAVQSALIGAAALDSSSRQLLDITCNLR